MKFFLTFAFFLVAAVVAQLPKNVPYNTEQINSCTPGRKFVTAPRSRYVFECIKPGDARVVACRDFDGKELALGATFYVTKNGQREKYHCYVNNQGVIESDKIQ